MKHGAVIHDLLDQILIEALAFIRRQEQSAPEGWLAEEEIVQALFSGRAGARDTFLEQFERDSLLPLLLLMLQRKQLVESRRRDGVVWYRGVAHALARGTDRAHQAAMLAA